MKYLNIQSFHYHLSAITSYRLAVMLPSTIAHSIAALSLFILTGHGAKLTKVDNFGFNPTDIQMYIYVPDRLAPKPAVVMGVSINSFQR